MITVEMGRVTAVFPCKRSFGRCGTLQKLITLQMETGIAFIPKELFLWAMWTLTRDDYCTDGDSDGLHSHLAAPLGDVQPYKR